MILHYQYFATPDLLGPQFPPPMPARASLPGLRPLLRAGAIGLLALAWSVRPAPLSAHHLRGSPTAPLSAPADRGQSAPAIDWGVLAALNLRTGEPSDSLRQLDGRRVRLAGFVVPLEDFQERAAEFLLVPYFGACVHMPPPPANQMVYARVRTGVVPLSLFAPVWLEGTLRITRVQSVYGAASYRMTVESITPYRKERD